MTDLLFSSSTWIFGTALGIVFGMALLELVFLLLGAAGPGQWLGDLLPEMDFDVDGDGSGGHAFDWLAAGRLPFMIVLLMLLSNFGALGLILQVAMREITGMDLPQGVAGLVALLGALPLTRFLSRVVGRWFPHEETSAISLDELVGRVGVVVVGTARRGVPAQVRVQDSHGKDHYIRVEPAMELMEIHEKSEVLITQRLGSNLFLAVASPRAS